MSRNPSVSSTAPQSSQAGQVAWVHRGWLWKHGGRVKTWKRRYFVLDGAGRLTYYSQESEAEAATGALGIIDIHKALYVTARVKGEDDGAWPESVPVQVCFTIITNDRNYGIYAEDEKSAVAWVKQLQAVRGGVDTSDILVEAQEAQPQPARRQSMSSHMAAFCQRYKMFDLSPKLQMMWLKWNNVGERALKALKDHFDIVDEITMQCDAGGMYRRLPTNRRNRIGEHVFADYMDELRHNLCTEFGSDEILKQSFRKAFSERKIKVELSDEENLLPNTAKFADGCLHLTIFIGKFGSGIHLAGKGLVSEVTIAQEDAEVSGSSVAGVRANIVAGIVREMPALQRATADLQKKLPGQPKVKFLCDFKDTIEKVADLDREKSEDIGAVVIPSIAVRFVTELTAYVSRAGEEVGDRIAGESGALELVFKVGEAESSDPQVELNSDGQLVVLVSAKKLLEMHLYDRTHTYNFEEVLA